MGVNVELPLDSSSSMTDSKYNWVIHAFTLTLWGNITLPGRNLTIVAHTLVCKSRNSVLHGIGCLIDVSGNDGKESPEKGDDAMHLGEDGGNGTRGADGINAGNVYLYAEQVEVGAVCY